jgi:hypothetical protein
LFKAPATFLADKDFVSEGPITKLDMPAKLNTETIGTVGFSTADNMYMLVFDTKVRATLTGVKLDFTDFPKGTYQITFTNITTGTATTQSVEVTDAQPQLTLPNFSKGLVISTPLIEPIVTGVEESRLMKKIIAYPNPSHDEVSFNITELFSGEITFLIYNAAGKKIGSEKKIHNGDGPVSISLRNYNLVKGIYLVKINLGELTINRRIVFDGK